MPVIELAVLIPTHNRREQLRRSLLALRGALPEETCQVVVLCDTCSDGTEAMLADEFPEVLARSSSRELWWSESINQGVGAVQAERYLFWNDDVEPGPNQLEELLRASRAHPGCILGSSIYYASAPERAWNLGGLVDWRGRGALVSTRSPGDEQPYEVSWLTGMGSLVPASVFERIGLVDSRNFPQYFGDADFFLRARRAGIRVLVCPRARMLNDVSSTGMLLPPGPRPLRQTWPLLTSLRSHSNFKIRTRFLLRHCPVRWLAWQVLRYYGPLLAAMVKKDLEYRLRRLTA